MRFAICHASPLPMYVPEPLLTKELTPTSFANLEQLSPLPLNTSFTFSPEIQKATNGKRLLLHELPFHIEMIFDHYKNGYIHLTKSITFKKGLPKCHRCGNDVEHLFARHVCEKCQSECVYCRHCITMGKVSACTPLITWTGPAISYDQQDRVLRWDGTLSPGQKEASDRITSAVGKNETWLVWAVCGSGKTEILFEAINRAIQLGQNVLFATPRSDVVLELTPRLKAVFPTVLIRSLYGGSDDRGKDGQLILATTHQVLRYDDHFDLIVIDEVDAFPYSYDPMLKFATEKAAKKNATKILLSATPDKTMQKQVEKGIINCVKIPSRYHGHPLPIPRLQWSGNWRKLLEKNKIPPCVFSWIKEKISSKQQAFLFVPSVIVLHILTPILKKISSTIESVHSEDQQRREKVQQFRDSSIQILITTTILERGVTVPNVAVAVFGAEETVFTESALVQICGRVGRSAQYPSGEIIFFHYGKTEAMLDAIYHIESMNKLGGFTK